MKVVFSPSADAILGRHPDFRDGLVKALGALPGNCFIDGRVGRSPAADRVVLLCLDRETITVAYDEFGSTVTIERIVKQWCGPAPQ